MLMDMDCHSDTSSIQTFMLPMGNSWFWRRTADVGEQWHCLPFGRLVADEEKMIPSHQLWVSALSFLQCHDMVGWQERHLVHTKTYCLCPNVVFQNSRRNQTKGNRLTRVHLETAIITEAVVQHDVQSMPNNTQNMQKISTYTQSCQQLITLYFEECQMIFSSAWIA